jgi:hypothetical protein
MHTFVGFICTNLPEINPSSYSYIFDFLSRNKYILLILMTVTYIGVHKLT